MTFFLTDLPPWLPKGKREEPLLILVQTTSIPASAVDHLEPLPNEVIPYKREKAEHRWDRATLGAGLVSVSGVLVLGVLTLDYRIIVNSPNRKRVNPGKSGAGFQSSVHHEVGNGRSKRRKRNPVYGEYRAIVIARGESEYKYVCGVSGVRNTRRRTGKGKVLYV